MVILLRRHMDLYHTIDQSLWLTSVSDHAKRFTWMINEYLPLLLVCCDRYALMWNMTLRDSVHLVHTLSEVIP